MGRQLIDDDLWEKLQGLLPKPKGRHGTNDRLFLEAICWMLRTDSFILNLKNHIFIAVIPSKKSSIAYLARLSYL